MSKKGRRLRTDLPEEAESSVWIRTSPRLDGAGYVVTVDAGEDRAVTLSPEAALRYASVVLAATARAAYDAAVAAQLRDLVPDPSAAVQLVVDMRKDRPPLDDAATAPLRLEPGVNAQLEAFLTIYVDEDPVGQWDVPAGREHALMVLEAVQVADLDASYLRVLTSMVGLDSAVAMNVVEDLVNWRP